MLESQASPLGPCCRCSGVKHGACPSRFPRDVEVGAPPPPGLGSRGNTHPLLLRGQHRNWRTSARRTFLFSLRVHLQNFLEKGSPGKRERKSGRRGGVPTHDFHVLMLLGKVGHGTPRRGGSGGATRTTQSHSRGGKSPVRDSRGHLL